MFLGYNEKYKGYRYLHPPIGKVYISRHVLFNELQFPFTDVYKDFQASSTSPLLSDWHSGVLTTSPSTSSSSTDQSSPEDVSVSVVPVMSTVNQMGGSECMSGIGPISISNILRIPYNRPDISRLNTIFTLLTVSPASDSLFTA